LVYILPLTVCVYLYSYFSAGLRNTILLSKSVFRPFKVIQGNWFWCQSKARMRLPISPPLRQSNLGPVLHRFWDIAGFCAPDHIPIPP